MKKEFNCNHYEFKTPDSERLCYQSLVYLCKRNINDLLNANIAILEAHHKHMRTAVDRNRCERTMDHLEALKLDKDAVFDTRLPVRFR